MQVKKIYIHRVPFKRISPRVNTTCPVDKSHPEGGGYFYGQMENG